MVNPPAPPQNRAKFQPVAGATLESVVSGIGVAGKGCGKPSPAPSPSSRRASSLLEAGGENDAIVAAPRWRAWRAVIRKHSIVRCPPKRDLVHLSLLALRDGFQSFCPVCDPPKQIQSDAHCRACAILASSTSPPGAVPKDACEGRQEVWRNLFSPTSLTSHVGEAIVATEAWRWYRRSHPRSAFSVRAPMLARWTGYPCRS